MKQFHSSIINTPIPKKQKLEDGQKFDERKKAEVPNDNLRKKRTFGRNSPNNYTNQGLRRSPRKRKPPETQEIVTIESSGDEELEDTDEELVDDNDNEVDNQLIFLLRGKNFLYRISFFQNYLDQAN